MFIMKFIGHLYYFINKPMIIVRNIKILQIILISNWFLTIWFCIKHINVYQVKMIIKNYFDKKKNIT